MEFPLFSLKCHELTLNVLVTNYNIFVGIHNMIIIQHLLRILLNNLHTSKSLMIIPVISRFSPSAFLNPQSLPTFELFSVMVHSGSAAGGHYYAHIKSFSDGQWYSFNDQHVSKVSL